MDHSCLGEKALAVAVLVACAPIFAEEPRAARTPAAPGQTGRDADPVPTGTERPGQGQLQRDFGFPGAIRSWERSFYLNPRNRSVYGSGDYGPWDGYGRWYDYSPYDSSYYHDRPPTGDNRVYRGTGYEDYSLRLDHAYDLGVAPQEIQDAIAVQAERSLSEYRDVMRAGHRAFAVGAYSAAARYFLLAADLNHGDPSSRLCAAHAQTALGRYYEAASLVHRAFDLQSKLVYLPIEIRGSYDHPDDLATHVEGLRAAAERDDSTELWFLLGYYYHNCDQPKLAAQALQRSRALSPNDHIVRRFADVACGVSP